MNLTGLEIEVGGVKKFVGKVGLCPKNGPLSVAGQIILYREVPWRDLFSFQTNSIGVDADAWDEAVALGATAMVTYSKEKQTLCVVPARTMKEVGRVDLGERLQVRVPLHRVGLTNPYPAGIKMGFTNKVRLVGQAPKRAAEPQLGLF